MRLTIYTKAALALSVHIFSFIHLADSAYSPVAKIESARLYGNINSYAYYFVDLEVGRPVPQTTSVIVDTGSNLVGFPCNGKGALAQHVGDHLYPPFDLSKSQTGRWLPCFGHQCNNGCANSRCGYSMYYTEGSSITGDWFEDYVKIGDLDQKNPAVYAQLGCHENEKKLFYTQRANGIMGLAPSDIGGTPTILADLFKDDVHVNQDIFSLCLSEWGGKLNIGGYNETYHTGQIAWLPMTLGRYYVIQLDSITVAPVFGQPVVAPLVAGQESFGPAMLDSGTTYVYFPGPVFAKLDKAIHSTCESGACHATKFDEECWKLDDGVNPIPSAFPKILMKFGGNSITWHPHAYLYQRGDTNIWCRAYADNGVSMQTVLGASWMLQREVIFDVQAKRAGLVEAVCPSYHRGFTVGRKNEILPLINWKLDSFSVSFFFLVAASLLSMLSLSIARTRCRSTYEASAQSPPEHVDDELGIE